MREAFATFLQNIKVTDRTTLKCVEVGVGGAVHAFAMLTELPGAKFYLVDSYDVNHSTFQFGMDSEGKPNIMTPDARQAFIDSSKAKIMPVAGERVEWLIEDSVVAAQRFPDETFDFVYIDAQHEFKDVSRDILAWRPKVKKGGFLAGHDAHTMGVSEARAILLKDESCVGDDWWIKK